ncbi:hypothetical protein GA0070563_112123 [Micromonospora carbonacea]|uniref:Uncharacterized protein n=2 Tax=Micromonospora carbonacea TaxID=47853 RepID=A0A1C5ACE7_9ACTN|nr:hypothetical protein GA0070563_112123 [Micromonospora carbonacea]
MAAPIIRSIVASPDTVQPGQAVQVWIDAFDPDARTITLSGSVTDANGATASATTTVTVGDPLTYELTANDPGVTIVEDPSAPGRFTVSVA